MLFLTSSARSPLSAAERTDGVRTLAAVLLAAPHLAHALLADVNWLDVLCARESDGGAAYRRLAIALASVPHAHTQTVAQDDAVRLTSVLDEKTLKIAMACFGSTGANRDDLAVTHWLLYLHARPAQDAAASRTVQQWLAKNARVNSTIAVLALRCIAMMSLLSFVACSCVDDWGCVCRSDSAATCISQFAAKSACSASGRDAALMSLLALSIARDETS
jgi:hypothetical protein